MQNENDLVFQNELQQFASTIINNKDGSIAAIFGGRNYQGQKILNRAYDILIQPASTIKILLDYALAFEYLNWSNKEILSLIPPAEFFAIANKASSDILIFSSSEI